MKIAKLIVRDPVELPRDASAGPGRDTTAYVRAEGHQVSMSETATGIVVTRGNGSTLVPWSNVIQVVYVHEVATEVAQAQLRRVAK